MSTKNKEIIPRRIKVTYIKENPLLYEIEYNFFLALRKFDTNYMIINGKSEIIGDLTKEIIKIIFSNEDIVEKILNSGPIIIDGTVFVIERVYKNVTKHKHNAACILHLPLDVTEEDLIEKFRNYNPTKVVISYKDRICLNGRYGIIAFDSKLNRDLAVCENRIFYINGKKCRLVSSKRDFD